MPSPLEFLDGPLLLWLPDSKGLAWAWLLWSEGTDVARIEVGDRHPAYFWPGNSLDSARRGDNLQD